MKRKPKSGVRGMVEIPCTCKGGPCGFVHYKPIETAAMAPKVETR